MTLILPTLLARANGEENPTAVYHETSTRLLELAAVNQGVFRGTVAGLTAEQRAFMEGVVKAGRAGSAGIAQRGVGGDEEEGRPSIALRMDFGKGS
jgi:HEAT repeat-containing protein 5